ncbi:hypothetical protein [Taibaiella chishuiensis]|uniref:Uncharacterized protein n=1 Tax=Taibaiella chishuiensis TaxID=1434707 RepID=A0A2P8D1F0_9BACT|nr:hypothetical protein [Taibaiella chishuiensis]PSK91039.1 hypothetical protein B0I18_10649 [Taibaiella chishuiensis]
MDIIEEQTSTIRKLLFCEIEIEFRDTYTPNDADLFRSFFSRITKLSEDKDSLRYQKFGDKVLFMKDVIFDVTDKFITGKFFCIRTDVFPQIINMNSDELTDIVAGEQDGIAETSHFVIDYRSEIIKMSIEYNHSGAKISDFNNYCGLLGIKFEATSKFNVLMISASENHLKALEDKRTNISEFKIRILQSNLSLIQNADQGLYSALRNTFDLFDPKYAELKLKFDYKKQAIPKAKDMISNVVKSIKSDLAARKAIDTLSVRAENPDKNFKMELYDLLVEKLKTEITVKRKARSRAIVSEDILPKMREELIKIKI